MIKCNRQGRTIKHVFDSTNKACLKDFYCADVHGGRSFLLNDAGYPLNDVDMILRQQDANLRESLISQLQEVPTTGVPAETPNAEVLLGLKSRYAQTPSEMVSFYEKQIDIQMEKMRAQHMKETENVQIASVDANEVIDNV